MNKKSAEDKKILDGKIFAAVSYLFILCAIPLIFKNDNTFTFAHGKKILSVVANEGVPLILTGDFFIKCSL
ncbi:MAG: hypothetical protein AB7S78_11835 [Candidatus Omnitrophota bacterium]